MVAESTKKIRISGFFPLAAPDSAPIFAPYFRFIYERGTCRMREYRPSTLVTKNVVVSGKRTSVRLEPVMWLALYDVARQKKCTLHDLVSEIGILRPASSSLTALIR